MVDDRLIILLTRRLIIIKKIGRLKRQKNLLVLDKTRWQKVLLARMKKAEELGVDSGLVKVIFQAIHKEALKVEKFL